MRAVYSGRASGQPYRIFASGRSPTGRNARAGRSCPRNDSPGAVAAGHSVIASGCSPAAQWSRPFPAPVAYRSALRRCGETRVARVVLEELLREIDERKLEEWETGEMI